MEWTQDGRTHRYEDPGPGTGPLSRLPVGSELKVRVSLGPVSFYALTRLWSADRIRVSWHDDSYAYRKAWIPARWVRTVTDEEYRAEEARRFAAVETRTRNGRAPGGARTRS
ncbi:hypothetical protein [Sinomonas terrae]|uniref:Uncharacterized protein n=1 Tax=Sinomonas terrae TaxID=2908838 RepID=A0ABS9U5W0_9MICC|nr:hypothetical protein [Sinomonas terrae]MCH6472086.1 hypothetical protein [Sinomonas terrae]